MSRAGSLHIPGHWAGLRDCARPAARLIPVAIWNLLPRPAARLLCGCPVCRGETRLSRPCPYEGCWHNHPELRRRGEGGAA